ncbi:hypothetical protein EOM86_04965 [Candidatus Nomurabacteria bacterium]|nr:hypothetical protein [Candidatus Nomurabacteria bacterium]
MNEKTSKLAAYMDKNCIAAGGLAVKAKRTVSSIYLLRKTGINDFIVACGYAHLLNCDPYMLWEGGTQKWRARRNARISEANQY